MALKVGEPDDIRRYLDQRENAWTDLRNTLRRWITRKGRDE